MPDVIYFFADPINIKFPGFSKILEKIMVALPKAKIITTLEGRDRKQTIVPMGIGASNMLLKQGFKPEISFLIDAMTLGFASVCKFYLRRHDFFNKNLRLDFLRYVKYYPVEKRIIKSYDKVIVVSEHDAEYLRNKFRVNNIITISNGADIPKTHPVAKRPFNYSIGILSYWGAGAEQDTSWFILDYLPKLKKHFPELKLVTAGRGASPETITFLEDHGVKHLGEVDTLDMFFNEIDIYITTLRKECGILNKVLDAFAYKKIVLGLEHNMYAFKNLKNGYLTWSTFDELVKAITFIHDNQDLVWEMEDNAFVYIVKHHSWEKNYAILKSMIRQYSTT